MLRRWRLWRLDNLERRKALLLDIAEFSGDSLKRQIAHELVDINYTIRNLRRKTNDR